MEGTGSDPMRARDDARKASFIELALEYEVLRFGAFTLKSGRRSPYFFNAGHFHDARALARVGAAYADTIVDAGLEFDVLFGPAYKGIPLAVATAVALARDHARNCGVAYNRKEAKDHGEGGVLVGAPLAGRVLLVDDVITAGTAVREVLPLVEAAGGRVTGIVTALDRQERGAGTRSAVQELAEELGVPVLAIVTLEDLAEWLARAGRSEEFERVHAYRAAYGVTPLEGTA
jgi:orotate phosphoribosyltransferase